MTQEESARLHTALFARLLHEVKDGSLMDAQKALEMLEARAAALTLEALAGDDGIPDGT